MSAVKHTEERFLFYAQYCQEFLNEFVFSDSKMHRTQGLWDIQWGITSGSIFHIEIFCSAAFKDILGDSFITMC